MPIELTGPVAHSEEQPNWVSPHNFRLSVRQSPHHDQSDPSPESVVHRNRTRGDQPGAAVQSHVELMHAWIESVGKSPSSRRYRHQEFDIPVGEVAHDLRPLSRSRPYRESPIGDDHSRTGTRIDLCGRPVSITL